MTKDQINLEAFFGALLEDVHAGALRKDQAIGALVAFTVAVNSGKFDEARRWAEQGRKFARDLVPLDGAAMLLSRPTGIPVH